MSVVERKNLWALELATLSPEGLCELTAMREALLRRTWRAKAKMVADKATAEAALHEAANAAIVTERVFKMTYNEWMKDQPWLDGLKAATRRGSEEQMENKRRRLPC